MTVNVTEVLGRSEQGVIAPFLCRCGDGYTYYVKGKGAGLNALIREWIATQLAISIGLPVPPAELAEVAGDLIHYGAREDLQELGEGTWFGSRRVENVIELPFSCIEQVEPDLRARIVLFDWWVLNRDRTLGEAGGNPNLLWDASREELHVIDHNLAFDEEWEREFWDHHIFSGDCQLWSEPFVSGMKSKLEAAEKRLQDFWNAMPGEWYEDMSAGISIADVERMLHRRTSADFWRAA